MIVAMLRPPQVSGSEARLPTTAATRTSQSGVGAICQHMGPMSGRENHRRAATAPSSRIAAAVTFVFADRYFGAWQTDKCRSRGSPRASGPGLWPGPRCQARWVVRSTGAHGRQGRPGRRADAEGRRSGIPGLRGAAGAVGARPQAGDLRAGSARQGGGLSGRSGGSSMTCDRTPWTSPVWSVPCTPIHSLSARAVR